jgi:hypothetical protein
MFHTILCTIKDLSALVVRLAQGPLNLGKIREPEDGGGKHRKKNVDCICRKKYSKMISMLTP